ncbi:MAG: glutamate--tRNA ligase [Candidatus Saccharimonadales bacterium]
MAVPVRTRFAPSPTGFLHVGGIRTALFAWLVARQGKGQFILRIEDTDQSREVAGAEDHITKSLKALSLNYDEGPDIGGLYAPYRQSERLEIYKKWAQKLIDSGRAYADPYTPEQVQAFRDEAQAKKQPFLYRNHRPDKPPAWDGSMPLRFESDPKAYEWHDEVMGNLRAGPEVIDDFILIKSDGYPTYNFAHIVDDAEMKISHVIRGQEFIASVPAYLNLYEALKLTPPLMATMPHILAPEGNKKLSKRDGARDVLDYISEGFLAEALLNFVASLGWNDGTEQEIFSREELIKKFSLARVGRSGAKFDERRLLWINGYYIRELPIKDLSEKVKNFWPAEAASTKGDYKERVLVTIQDRLKFFKELPELTLFFFKDQPINPELWQTNNQLKQRPVSELKNWLEQTRDNLEKSDFCLQDLTIRLNALLQQTNQKPAVLFSLIRIAVTQAPFSPGLAETLSVLGQERTLRRLNAMINSL